MLRKHIKMKPNEEGVVEMIYVTGDVHGSYDMRKLNTKNFPEQKVMTKSDFLFVCGDLSVVWDDGKEDRYLRKQLSDHNFTLLFTDGNHENFDLLDAYPVEMWNGGKVHFITDSIIHLLRGQVFTIDDVKLFTFGGAPSHDTYRRTPGVSWWEREMPSDEEYFEGIVNLAKHNYQVDYIFSHDCSSRMFDLIHSYLIRDLDREKTSLSEYFDVLEDKVTFKHWYFGHYHEDEKLDSKHTLLYRKIVRIV